MDLKVKIKLEEGALLPVKGEPNAMCYDCFAHKIKHQEDGKVFVTLGFSATPPKGYGIRLIPRSSLTKHWWVFNNSIGIGDEDYKGVYQARFIPILKPDRKSFSNELNFSNSYFEDFPYEVGDRVCQMEIYKRNDFEFETVEELSGEDRGGGFGSTDKELANSRD